MDQEVRHEIRDRMSRMNITIEDLEDTLVLLRQTLIPHPSSSFDQFHPTTSSPLSTSPNISESPPQISYSSSREKTGRDKQKEKEKEEERARKKEKEKEKKSRGLSLKGATKRGKTKRSISQPDLLSSLTFPLTPPIPFFPTSSPFGPTSDSLGTGKKSSSSGSKVGKGKSKSLNRGVSSHGQVPGEYVVEARNGDIGGRGLGHEISGSGSGQTSVPMPIASGQSYSISRDEKGRSVIPTKTMDGAKEKDKDKDKDKDKNKDGAAMNRSTSHSQAHGNGHGHGHGLLGHLFHRRPSGHKLKIPNPDLLTVPTPSPPLSNDTPSIHSLSPTPTMTVPPSISTTTSATTTPPFTIVSTPQTLLEDLAKSIADLRHQHSSLLTLYPLSSASDADGEGMDGDRSGEVEYHSVVDLEVERRAERRIRSRERSLTLGSGSGSGSETSSLRELDDVTPKEEGGQSIDNAAHSKTGANGFANGNRTNSIDQPRRRTGHKNHAHRSSLSSMYAEVASIYYDAELVHEPDEESVGRQDGNGNVARVRASPSTLSEEDLEHALKAYEAQQQARSTPPLSPTQTLPTRTALSTPSTGLKPRRTALPSPTPAHEPSLMGMLRKNVGKDLSTIAFDVTFNEPISLLQKLAEEVEYVNLLKLAAIAVDPIERIAHIAAFAVSQYANGKHRTSRKPFNPLMGETFELIRPELGMCFIAEKVRHHPPKLACHAGGEGWRYWSTSSAKNKLAGMSLEILPTGSQYVELTAKGERYSWSKPPSYMRNLVAGTRYMETIGDLLVINETTGERCVVTFKEGGWGGSGRNVVSGICYTADGTKSAWISGIWDSHLDVRYGGPKDPSHPLWLATPWPAKPERNYGFTRWAIELNEPIGPDELPLVAPSDSRLRPDQRLLEEGFFTEADETKKRLEDAQRTRRAAGHEHKSRWFLPTTGDAEDWEYKGGYFEAREAQVLSQQSANDLW